ncbi:zinc ribbon domain-containing protein, partial [Akkermansia muciniphila]
MLCPKCGHDVKEGLFCTNCGSPLPLKGKKAELTKVDETQTKTEKSPTPVSTVRRNVSNGPRHAASTPTGGTTKPRKGFSRFYHSKIFWPLLLLAILAAFLLAISPLILRNTHAKEKSTAGQSSIKKPAKLDTAEDYIAALKENGCSIRGYEVYGANNDPNHLLGQPHKYTGKASFFDSSLPHDHVLGEDGGTIEVFSTVEDCHIRYDY